MTGLEKARVIEEVTTWRKITRECCLCGQAPKPQPDDDLWLEELELLAEATLL